MIMTAPSTMTLPTLYKRTSTGAIQTWSISAGETYEGTELQAYIEVIYGQFGTDSPQQTREWIREGKNVGRANETTPLQQAEAEAVSRWEKKVKKGYVQNIEDAQEKKVDTNFVTGGVDSMLAQGYDKHGHKIRYPAFIQPKLDGHRCIAIITDDEATLWSRTRKPITGVPHIAQQLLDTFGDVAATMPNGQIILDGELYNHDYRDKFEELTSKIRQSTPKPGHEVVQYWVYDFVASGYDFGQRIGALDALKGLAEGRGTSPSLIFVDTVNVDSSEEMIKLFGVFVDHGFEGAMVRNASGMYVGKRSYDLQKVKIMQDAEFEVVDVEEGRGKMKGHAMFVCLLPCEQCKGVGDYPPRTRQVCNMCNRQRGKTFRVKMMGAMDDLKTMYDNREQYIGKMLTVKFQKLSAEGIPIFPVAVRFREDV